MSPNATTLFTKRLYVNDCGVQELGSNNTGLEGGVLAKQFREFLKINKNFPRSLLWGFIITFASDEKGLAYRAPFSPDGRPRY